MIMVRRGVMECLRAVPGGVFCGIEQRTRSRGRLDVLPATFSPSTR